VVGTTVGLAVAVADLETDEDADGVGPVPGLDAWPPQAASMAMTSVRIDTGPTTAVRAPLIAASRGEEDPDWLSVPTVSVAPARLIR
jgi:hypothetical protein